MVDEKDDTGAGGTGYTFVYGMNGMNLGHSKSKVEARIVAISDQGHPVNLFYDPWIERFYVLENTVSDNIFSGLPNYATHKYASMQPSEALKKKFAEVGQSWHRCSWCSKVWRKNHVNLHIEKGMCPGYALVNANDHASAAGSQHANSKKRRKLTPQTQGETVVVDRLDGEIVHRGGRSLGPNLWTSKPESPHSLWPNIWTATPDVPGNLPNPEAYIAAGRDMAAAGQLVHGDGGEVTQ